MKLILTWIVFLLVLTGCAPEDLSLDPYSARADAQATQAAADARLAATQAKVSGMVLQVTIQAALTRGAAEAEIQALSAQMTATQAALNVSLAQAEATAQSQAIQATQTAQAVQVETAWPQTATPLAATQAAIVRDAARNDRRAYWSQVTDPFVVIMPPLLWFTALLLLVIGSVFAYRRLLPVLELRFRAVPRGANDAPIILYDGIVVDPDRNFGPALILGPGGAMSSGHAPDPHLQARVTTLDQLVDLVRGLPKDRRGWKQANRLLGMLSIPELPSGETRNIEIIEPDQVAGWLSEAERKLLLDGEGEKL